LAKNFHNGTNLIVKHYIIFLGEEILEFFMAPAVKTHLSVLAQKIPAIGAKGVCDRKVVETCLISAPKIHQKKTFFLMGQNLF